MQHELVAIPFFHTTSTNLFTPRATLAILTLLRAVQSLPCVRTARIGSGAPIGPSTELTPRGPDLPFIQTTSDQSRRHSPNFASRPLCSIGPYRYAFCDIFSYHLFPILSSRFVASFYAMYGSRSPLHVNAPHGQLPGHLFKIQ